MNKTITAAVATAAALALPTAATSKALPQLFGAVGPGNVLTLKDKAGKPIRTLKPGKYTITVQDQSKTQNFHLVGPGLNVKTSIKGRSSSGWAVVLKAGSFRYYSDAAPSKLKGSFKVST
ncbi:MAG TPA: hypothetical protein VF101_14330 [Gaiellaceae bacterium]